MGHPFVAPVTVRAVHAPWRHRTPDRTDLLLALVPALAALAGLVSALASAPFLCPCRPPFVVLASTLPLVVLTAVPVLWVRVAPLAATIALGLVGSAGYVVVELLHDSGVLPSRSGAPMLLAVTGLVVAFPAAYGVARNRSTPALVGALAILAVSTAAMTTYYSWRGGTATAYLLIGFTLVVIGHPGLLAPVWVVGFVRGRQARQDAERAHRNAERAERAVRDERARVLRELQGLVLADLASIGQEAERAGRVLDADAVDPGARADARTALLSMTATGRDTLTAMRRLLGMLRTTEPDGVQAPQPTLDRLDELVEVGRRAGLDVRVTVSGERRPLPDDVDLAAYRLLQRVLSDCGAALPVRLQVSYADQALRLVVRGDVGEGGGVAVREWVRMVGGEVVAGRGSSSVEVRLPAGRARAA